jgi:hypothetical protein
LQNSRNEQQAVAGLLYGGCAFERRAGDKKLDKLQKPEN